MPKLTTFFLLGAIAASWALPFSVLAGLLVLAAVAFTAHSAVAWRPVWGLDGVMLGWLIWIPASLSWSLSAGLGLGRAATLLALPLAYLAWRRLASWPRAELALQALIWALLALLALWGILQGPDTFTAKPQGPFNDPNTYAGVLNLLALPLLAQYLAADLALVPAWRRTLQLAVFGMTALVFFLTASRGATLTLVLASLPLIWMARAHSRFLGKMGLLAVVVGTAYLCSLWVGSPDILVRLAVTVRDGDSSRVMLMQAALAMIADHPWLGSGLGSFRLLYPRYRLEGEAGTAGGWVHNDYLQLWQEAGLPMLLLVVALLAWIGREMWRTLRTGRTDGSGLVRLGFLAGAMAIFIQAATNFMFYFAFISLMLGLYLGRVQPAPLAATAALPMPRAWRMTVTAYGAILAWLFTGEAAVDALLDRTTLSARAFVQAAPAVSRYELAYWLSVLAPFHPTPPQAMGIELSEMLSSIKATPAFRAEMLDEALFRMETSQRLAPCYLPFGIKALDLIVRHGQGMADIARGERTVARNLACNPRHGQSYYYAGLLREKAGDKTGALRVWHAGLPKTHFFADRLMLATAILARTTPGHEEDLSALAGRMATLAYYLETHPNAQTQTQPFWAEAQYRLLTANREGFRKLVPPPTLGT